MPLLGWLFPWTFPMDLLHGHSPMDIADGAGAGRSPSPRQPPLGASGEQARPGRCNTVCNEKSKQGMAARHDRNVFPLEKPVQRKSISKAMSRRPFSWPARKTDVIVHGLSRCQPSLTGLFSLMLSLSLSLSPLRCLPPGAGCLLRWTVTPFGTSCTRPGRHAWRWAVSSSWRPAWPPGS